MQKGNWAVLAMLVIGFAAAAFAWQWNLARGKRAKAFWGAEAAVMIRNAPQAQALRLRPLHPRDVPPEDSAAVLTLGDERWEILQTVDISQAAGLIHARNSLLEDASFQWETPGADDPIFRSAVRFTRGGKELVVLIDPETKQVRSDRQPRTGELVPHVAEGWGKAFGRYFAVRP